MAKLHHESYGEPAWVGDYREAIEQERREREEALTRYEETGDLKGYFYTSPTADSYAVYRVVKLRPFTVQHVQWGDGWNLPAAHIRGLRIEDVKAHADQELAWRRLREEQKG